jgi:hypothetical protein
VTPTQRTLKLLRDRGYTCAITEHWNGWAKVRQDLFGFIDIVAVKDGTVGVLAVQTTSGSNTSARVAKIQAEPRASVWLAAGNKIVVHGWRKVGPRGKAKKWECREIPVTQTQEGWLQ